MEGLIVTVEQHGKVTVAKCSGFIDSQTAPVIETSITSMMEKKQYKIIIDLSKIDYVSSAGWEGDGPGPASLGAGAGAVARLGPGAGAEAIELAEADTGWDAAGVA
jgi:hypothetical protein